MDTRALRVDAPQELLSGDLQLGTHLNRRTLRAHKIHRPLMPQRECRELADRTVRTERCPVARFEHKHLWLVVRNKNLGCVLIQVVRFEAEVHRPRARLAPLNPTINEGSHVPVRDRISLRSKDDLYGLIRKNMPNERFLHDTLLYEQRLRCTCL